jgi:hypothetical protein
MSQPAIRPRALAIGGLIAVAAAVGIGRFIYTPLLPPMIEELGLGKGQACPAVPCSGAWRWDSSARTD